VDFHGWVALITLVAVVTLFLTRWIPMEATALAVPVLLAVTGTLDPASLALDGFGNHAVIAIAGIFVLGAGLKESGVASLLARLIERVGGRSESRTIIVIMVAVCALSAIMSSAATTAVFMPVAAVLARRTGASTSRLMMPLAYAAILGGTLTLIGTAPNMILGNDLEIRAGKSLGMFEFTTVGAPVAALGILYMAIAGRRLLPAQSVRQRMGDAAPALDIAKRYATAAQLYLMKVVDASRIAGKSVSQAAIGGNYLLDLLMVKRHGSLGAQFIHPAANLILQAGDEIYLEGETESAWRFAEEELVQFGVADPDELEKILGFGLTLAEVTPSPHSNVFGKTLKELRFRNQTGLSVIAIWRGGEPITSATADMPLQLGDALMVTGRMKRVREFARNPDFILLTDTSEREDVRRAPLALLFMVGALLPPLLGWLPLAVSVIGSGVLMGLTRCVSLTGARRAIDWRVLFLLIGTIPLGIAMDRHGVAANAANLIMDLHGTFGAPGVLASLFLLASALCLTCNNGAAAVILAPVAWKAAHAAGIEPAKAFLAVAFGASCAFLLPFGNQCNLMVMGPGGYRTRDYLRAGGGLTLLMATTTVILLSVL
jgi:di/tricarboxylate transporter